MTIIVYKDGWLWGDDLIFGERMIIGREPKIAYHKSGLLGGASGDGSACSLFLKWVKSGRRGKPPEVFSGENSVGGAIVVEKDGTICDYSGPEPSRIKADFYAIGMAQEVAVGAMMAGCTAMEATVAACKAYGWPAYLHGVNHDGQWDEFDTRSISEAAHHSRITTADALAPRRRT